MSAEATGPAAASDTLDFAYTWNVKEHAHAQHVIRLRNESTRLLFAGAVAVAIIANAIAGYYAINDDPVPLRYTLPGSLVFVVALWLALWSYGWLDAWRQRRTDSSLQYPIHLIIGGHGLRVRGKTAEVALRWKAMKRVTETRDFILFYFAHDKAYYLPKRVVAADQVGGLRAMIATHVGGAANLMS